MSLQTYFGAQGPLLALGEHVPRAAGRRGGAILIWRDFTSGLHDAAYPVEAFTEPTIGEGVFIYKPCWEIGLGDFLIKKQRFWEIRFATK